MHLGSTAVRNAQSAPCCVCVRVCACVCVPSSLRLVIAARSEATLNQTRDECLQYTSADKVVTVIADVGEESDCHRIADAVFDHFGGLDVLILNAAYSPRPSLVTELDNPVSEGDAIDRIKNHYHV